MQIDELSICQRQAGRINQQTEAVRAASDGGKKNVNQDVQ